MSKASDYAATFYTPSLSLTNDMEAYVSTDGKFILRSKDFRALIAFKPEEALALGQWLINMYGESECS